MDIYIISLLLLPIISSLLITIKLFTKSKLKLPPGPKPWPIIGNLHQLGDKPHRSVSDLSNIYGPIMSLKLGTITTIVISSHKVAEEMFLKHDLTFSSRPVPDSVRAGDHHKYSLVWLPICPRWRHLRRLASLQLFTTQRLDASRELRHTKVRELVEFARGCCAHGVGVDICNAAFVTTLNMLSNTIFSMDLASYGSLDVQEFKDVVLRNFELAGKPNVSDFFPLLRRFDLQGMLKKRRVCYNKIMGILGEIIDERIKARKDVKDDVLATLLKLVEDGELDLNEAKHLVMDLFTAGTDTTSNTLEWIMTELLCNPKTMERAQIEMDLIKERNKLVQESDIPKLEFLKAVVKETLRLHPPVPFLVPRKAEKETQLCGYLIPKHSTIWINVWSIGRNASMWSKSESFLPERFLEKEIDVNGRHFKLIPFGSGRRMCPGISLAHRMLYLMTANLLHSFNWKYVDEGNLNAINLEERFGLTLQKIKPLQAIPLPR